MSLTKKQSWIIIGSSVVCVLFCFLLIKGLAGGYFFHFSTLKGIVFPEEGLKGSHIAEMLDVSAEHLPTYDSFNIKKAYAHFSSYPFIKWARVKKCKGGWIEVDYEMRTPVARITNFTNTAIDSEGVLFPFYPYYTLKKLPTLCLPMASPISKNIWGKKIAKEEVDLVLSLFALCSKAEKLSLMHVDIAHYDEENLGREEIVIIFNHRGEKTLRLNAKNYAIQWKNWQTLKNFLKEGDCIIDMRLIDLAFVSPTKK